MEKSLEAQVRQAKNNDYETIELHTYVTNHRSHKFYFYQDFKILGLHFQKRL
jgi:hypothetical protein